MARRMMPVAHSSHFVAVLSLAPRSPARIENQTPGLALSRLTGRNKAPKESPNVRREIIG